MQNINRLSQILIHALAVLLFSGVTVYAESFPFRTVSVGDDLPALTLSEAGSGKAYAIPKGGKGAMVLAFWSADIATKKERSLKALKVLKEMSQYFKERAITLVVVNEGHDSPDVMNEVIKEAGLAPPVYLDSDQSAYGTLGIFVMPSLLVVDVKGKIAAGMGYSHDLDKRLHGELAVMLGEMDRAQLEKELHPTNMERPENEKSAERFFNLGKTMRQRGQPESAIAEFGKALAANPELSEALLQIGCLQVEIGQYDAARKSLTDGLAKDPTSVDGQICRAQVKGFDKEVDEALDDLRFLLLRNSRKANLHYVLGSLLLQKGNCAEAAPEFRTAYDLLLKKEMQE